MRAENGETVLNGTFVVLERIMGCFEKKKKKQVKDFGLDKVDLSRFL